ncbi:esterase lipase [Lacticaseibacillus thailandensis DSM 22698 = JCM 13996]|uniref:Esterase lipase n=1 Tax=Lacticaseibacillus thailandensis DSM 22698 = JCM 13996 TaxID=1423810 RepID=A0A0R2C749_9LACO|nr:esterase lipase [Lacticaseibacillus thailandensis DSM 22698 = JCM 13996]
MVPYFTPRAFKLSNLLIKPLKGLFSHDMRVTQVDILRPAGSSVSGDLRLCVYRPLLQPTAQPGMLWIHGGGFALGAPETETGFIRKFVVERGCTVVAPDYCLSTQAPYPAALEDCYLALVWTQQHATELNIRSNQLMVGGDSAGGGLTAAVAIRAQDRGQVAIAYQMPLYPMLDDRMTTASMQDNDAPVWNYKSNDNGWKLYLGDLFGTDQVPADAAPAREQDFRGLPPAFTFVGSIESFRDATVTYMQKLYAAGVPTECHVLKGCYHGFDIIAPNSPQAQYAHRLMMASFDYATRHYFAEQPGR